MASGNAKMRKIIEETFPLFDYDPDGGDGLNDKFDLIGELSMMQKGKGTFMFHGNKLVPYKATPKFVDTLHEELLEFADRQLGFVMGTLPLYPLIGTIIGFVAGQDKQNKHYRPIKTLLDRLEADLLDLSGVPEIDMVITETYLCIGRLLPCESAFSQRINLVVEEALNGLFAKDNPSEYLSMIALAAQSSGRTLSGDAQLLANVDSGFQLHFLQSIDEKASCKTRVGRLEYVTDVSMDLALRLQRDGDLRDCALKHFSQAWDALFPLDVQKAGEQLGYYMQQCQEHPGTTKRCAAAIMQKLDVMKEAGYRVDPVEPEEQISPKNQEPVRDGAAAGKLVFLLVRRLAPGG